MSQTIGPTLFEPQFRPMLICEAGHHTTTEQWRDIIERGDIRCTVPLGGQPCGREFEDVQLYIADVGTLLGVYRSAANR